MPESGSKGYYEKANISVWLYVSTSIVDILTFYNEI